MQESFTHKEGNPLEKNVLYTILNRAWPLSFQGYEYHPEGDLKKPKAVFWDFRGKAVCLSREEVALLITKTNPEQIKEYIASAKSLIHWLSTKETQIVQSQAKYTTMTPKEIEQLNQRTESNLELALNAQKAQSQAKYTDPLKDRCCGGD
jgi:hypothetical protein